MKVSRPTLEQLNKLESLSPAERRAVFSNEYSFILFFTYYYGSYVKSQFADFHLQWAEDFGDLLTGKIHELALVTGRDTAKTSFAQAFLVQCMANKWAKYFNVDAFERDNSERFLYECVVNLQSNHRLRFDYGDLFNAPSRKEEKTQKRISDFVTTTGLRAESHTTQEAIRGRLHHDQRPDWIALDDIENLKTIRSEAATKEVAEHLAELKGGVDQKNCRILYLCNKISEDGNVAKLIERSKQDKYFRVRQVWLLDENGQPSWPQRYVLTDEELKQFPSKTSIETIRRSMRSPDTGDTDFEREFLGICVDPFGNGPDRQGYLPLFPDFKPVTSQFVENPPYAIGVDPSGEGDDKSIVTVRSQYQTFIYGREKNSSGKSVASTVVRAMREYDVPANMVVVDSFGVGFKCVQELSLMGHRVKAVNVGEATEGLCGEKFFNDRAYMYFKLKEWLASGGALSDDPEWARQAKSIRFRTDDKNKIHLMPKKEIIKRGHRSPDELDSLALSFLVTLEPKRDRDPPRKPPMPYFRRHFRTKQDN